MPKMDVVTKVWIEEGCIVCDACETTAPDIFEVTEDSCIVRPAALDAEFNKPRTQSIIDAAEECPVDVIKFDTVSVEVDELPESAKPKTEADPATKEPAPAKAPAAAAAADPAPAASKSPVRGAAAAMAVDADPTIQALLKAATARGGAAEMQRKSAAVPEEIQEWKRKLASELPPDIRHARTMEAESRTASKKAESKKSDTDNQKSAQPNRREAIGGVALAGGWLAFGGAAAIMCGPAFGRFMMPNVLEEPDPKVRVGTRDRYADMANNDVNEDFKPKGIWMIRQEGQIAALNIICTHLGCIPNWLQNDGKFKCPCHGSGFKPTGINFEGPAPRPLERFKIYEENGQIVVDKSKKFQYERGEWENPDSFVLV